MNRDLVDRRRFIGLGLTAALLSVSGQVKSGDFHVSRFGARGTGLDETAEIQAAIDHAAFHRAALHFDGSKTYHVKSLVPRSHARLAGNGCTLRLLDGTEQPLFFDRENGGEHFVLDGFKLDGNQRFNCAGNQSSGGVWLTGWAGVRIRNVDAWGFFRNVLNIYDSSGVVIEHARISHCGMPNAAGYFSYGITIEPNCTDVSIRHVVIHDMHGFGVHLNQTTGWLVQDLHCARISFEGVGIALTLTGVRKGALEQFVFEDVDGGTLECNSCHSISISDGRIIRSGKRAITWGDNETGERSKSILVSHVTVAASRANASVSLNFLENVIFEKCVFDRDFEYMYVYPRLNILFRHCRFHFKTGPMNQLSADSGPIHYENCAFQDWTSIRKDKRRQAWRLTEPLLLPAHSTVRVTLESLQLPRTYRGQVILGNYDGPDRAQTRQFEFIRSAGGALMRKSEAGDIARFGLQVAPEKPEVVLSNRTALSVQAALVFIAMEYGADPLKRRSPTR